MALPTILNNQASIFLNLSFDIIKELEIQLHFLGFSFMLYTSSGQITSTYFLYYINDTPLPFPLFSWYNYFSIISTPKTLKSNSNNSSNVMDSLIPFSAKKTAKDFLYGHCSNIILPLLKFLLHYHLQTSIIKLFK